MLLSVNEQIGDDRIRVPKYRLIIVYSYELCREYPTSMLQSFTEEFEQNHGVQTLTCKKYFNQSSRFSLFVIIFPVSIMFVSSRGIFWSATSCFELTDC